MVKRRKPKLSKRRRLYTLPRWKRLARSIKLKEPFCRPCKAQGRITLATEVDHIIPRFKGGDDWSLDNLQPICRGCHIEKSRNEKPRNRIPEKKLKEILSIEIKYRNPQEREQYHAQKDKENKETESESKPRRKSSKRRN